MKKTLDLVVKITNWEPDGEDKWKDRMGNFSSNVEGHEIHTHSLCYPGPIKQKIYRRELTQ